MALALLLVGELGSRLAAAPPDVSGIYPHLAMFNDEAECGTGAVVPWAGKLWAVTYAPHKPSGSSDKLYEITPELVATVRPESIGGTPANRMIHRESQQLFIGPYAISAAGQVRVIPYSQMFGRPTGNARHLFDPGGKIYYATMEEGLYEVDVHTLAVRELWTDEQQRGGRHANLPGYHGKGLFSGQGRLVYANNGDHARAALTDPRTPSGALATWDGQADAWTLVRRNQFTEVTGPGGLLGNEHPETDPLWSIGWDHRSLILALLDGGRWHFFRLPKASHSYDGAHGWNTEWPRIRDVGEPDLLMTMHGMFWRFPRTFSAARTSGIRPRASYLKVIGDFCRWNERLVFGCDDAARSEFLNKRNVQGMIAGPGQSQSNLWFVEPEALDRLGPTLAGGSVWLRDRIRAGDTSEPFLFAGWERRAAHVVNGGTQPVELAFEIDRRGSSQWEPLRSVALAPGEVQWLEFGRDVPGEWIRVRAGGDCAAVTVHFAYSDAERRSREPDAIFAGLAPIDADGQLGGLIRARGENRRTLELAATKLRGSRLEDAGYFELDGSLALHLRNDPAAQAELQARVAIPRDVLTVDAASVLVVDDAGRRWRLPKSVAAFDEPTRQGRLRVSREVTTERDLFSAAGTFYELPAENAGGFARLRPIASHRLAVMDYCSYRGLLILTGIAPTAAAGRHILRSADGQAALWAGTVDDLWKLGKPVGDGGPWHATDVRANEPSDPYLLWGYDRRRLTLTADAAATILVEVDLTGDGDWVRYERFTLAPGRSLDHHFPDAFQARWLRCAADRNCRVTATLHYE